MIKLWCCRIKESWKCWNSTEDTLWSRIPQTPSNSSDGYCLWQIFNGTTGKHNKWFIVKEVRRHAACTCDFPPFPQLRPQSDIKQTCWNVNGAWPFCTQSWSSLHSRLLYCTAAGPSGTTSLLGLFQPIQTTFGLCSVSWAWPDGVSLRALFVLLLLIFALNWKRRWGWKSRLPFFFSMPHQMFQHVLYMLDSLWSVGGAEAAAVLSPKWWLGLKQLK